ncbi:MAG: PP2C family protein-serine/threonine phosphatase [Bernardetiaceae bacterium]
MYKDGRWDTALLLGGFGSWAGLTILDITEITHKQGVHDFDSPGWLNGLMLNLFLVFSYLYLRVLNQKKGEDEEFYGLLWKTTALGLVCVFASLSLGLFIRLLRVNDFAADILLISLFHHIDFALLTIFLLTAFRKWKIMVLYQPTRWVSLFWQVFETSLFAALFLHFFHFDLPVYIFYALTGIYVVLSFFTTANLRWIPYLDVRQKLMGIFMLFLILIVQVYFLNEMFRYAEQDALVIYVAQSVFFTSLFFFTALYAVVSLLVMLFHLPTSSVFEKKINELAGFQQVSESILKGSNEQRVYEVLLESAVQTIKADAAWLEIYDERSDFIVKNLSPSQGRALRDHLSTQGAHEQKPTRLYRSQAERPWPVEDYESLLALPLVANRRNLGRLVLLKEVDKAFDNVMVNSLNAFVTQASLAIYNFRLIADAVATQRYQEELNIAHRVQESLLPKSLPANEAFEMLVSTHSANEVGGDYYDFYQINEHKYALIIADVSGHGTSAAFNMAQMKGVFHSLVRLDLSPDLFFTYTNDALSGCLERNSFVTATYFIIDTQKGKIYTSRAGHCPTLYYTSQTRKATFLEDKGLGLGILRNSKYVKHIRVSVIDYQPGDLLVLYTDGIVEARDPETHAEYGFDRLRDFVGLHYDTPLEQMASRLITAVRKFSAHQIDDDYTILFVRFR